MLILTRRIGQSIMVGDDIIVTITQVGPGSTVRVGVQAPKNVRIDRTEIRDRINREKVPA